MQSPQILNNNNNANSPVKNINSHPSLIHFHLRLGYGSRDSETPQTSSQILQLIQGGHGGVLVWSK